MLIADLKKKIVEVLGIPMNTMRLIFGGHQLEDSKKLSDYDIVPRCSVFLMFQQCGGGSVFACLSQKPQRFDWSAEAPKWRTVTMGLCLEGICKNKSCKAYEKMVIINMGLPIIFKLGLVQNQTNCPICRQHVKPLACAFNNCYYRYIATIEEQNQEKRRVKSEWKQVGNYYSRFSEKNQANYASLVIEAKPINMYDMGYNLTEPVGCVYCLRKYEANDQELIWDCGYNSVSYYHANCKNDLEKKSMYSI